MEGGARKWKEENIVKEEKKKKFENTKKKCRNS